jgi:hypothetical protein
LKDGKIDTALLQPHSASKATSTSHNSDNYNRYGTSNPVIGPSSKGSQDAKFNNQDAKFPVIGPSGKGSQNTKFSVQVLSVAR